MIKDMNTGDVPQVNKGVNENGGKHPGNRTPAQEKYIPWMAGNGSPMMKAVQKPRQLYKGEWQSLAGNLQGNNGNNRLSDIIDFVEYSFGRPLGSMGRFSNRSEKEANEKKVTTILRRKVREEI